MELCKQEMELFLLLTDLQSKNFFYINFLTFKNESKTGFENRKWNYLNSEHFEHFEHSEHFMHSVHIDHFEHLGSRLTVSAPTEPQKGAGGLVYAIFRLIKDFY